MRAFYYARVIEVLTDLKTEHLPYAGEDHGTFETDKP